MRTLLASISDSDRWLQARVRRWRCPAWLLPGLQLVSALGNGVVWPLGLLALRPAFSSVRASALLLLAALTANALVLVFKSACRRPRPAAYEPNPLLMGAPQIVVRLDRYSFPSGHVANAFAVATVIGLAAAPTAPAFSALALAVAAARVALGQHYPSDVVAGACLGSGAAWAAALAFR
jgi:undecaprenyl-diphosphatase